MPRKRKQTTREKRVQDVTGSKESPDALRPEHSPALQQSCAVPWRIEGQQKEFVPHGHIITRVNGDRLQCVNGKWQKI
jgi:hypothetical protein